MASAATRGPVDPSPSGGSAAPEIVAEGLIAPAAGPAQLVTKVIVAVHGVGDQHSFGTIQSVVGQFCHYHDQPAATSLGSFHNRQAAYSFGEPYPEGRPKHLAFAEVYWANVPREVVREGYTLEEAKRWARTIVQRLRLRWRASREPGICREADFERLDQVLSEMIETIRVLERLSALGDRAGLFTFDLRKLLDDFLGDVQVVAEFEEHRRKILDTFAETLTKLHTSYPEAEIHLIAHSEGTVVAMLGLLEALRDPDRAPWVRRVRGFMTLGSPIDKHLVLWPELFGSAPLHPSFAAGAPFIEWRNYYDRGDPIGFALDGARHWMRRGAWDRAFRFEPEHDIGFTRYALPGKAHVDYWNDRDLFGNFIREVVEPPNEAAPPASESGRRPAPTRSYPRPGDHRLKKWLSYTVPYLAVAALLFLAVYLMDRAATGYLRPDARADQKLTEVLHTVAANALLLLGVTVAARVPRLTKLWRWRAAAALVYGASAAAFLALLPTEGTLDSQARAWVEGLLGFAVPVGGTRLLVATLVVVLAIGLSRARPAWGLRPLLACGGLGAAAVVGLPLYEAKATADVGPLWPVLLAAALFLYLWWLAALVFDLVFVWHVYIRQASALERLRQIVGDAALPPPALDWAFLRRLRQT